MKDSVELLKLYLSHFIHHFGVRSPETSYIHGQLEARYMGNRMVPDEYTATGHPRNPIGYYNLSISLFGSNHPGTKILKDWIAANPMLAGQPMVDVDEMIVVYAIGRIGLVGIDTKGDLLELLPK